MAIVSVPSNESDIVNKSKYFVVLPCFVSFFLFPKVRLMFFYICTVHLHIIKVYYSPTYEQVIVLKTILKFILKQLRHVSVQSHHLQEAHYPHLLKFHFVKIVNFESYVYWTVHHLDSWIKRDQLDATCFIISLFTAQHVSDVNTSILRSLWLIWWVISWVVLFWFVVCWCYVVVWLGWCGIRMQAEALVLRPAYGGWMY